jgi:hypothetical protein
MENKAIDAEVHKEVELAATCDRIVVMAEDESLTKLIDGPDIIKDRITERCFNELQNAAIMKLLQKCCLQKCCYNNEGLREAVTLARDA